MIFNDGHGNGSLDFFVIILMGSPVGQFHEGIDERLSTELVSFHRVIENTKRVFLVSKRARIGISAVIIRLLLLLPYSNHIFIVGLFGIVRVGNFRREKNLTFARS